MEQDYFIDSNEGARDNKDEDFKDDKSTKKVDPYVKILIFQGAICCAVIVACLIIKTFFGGLFSDIKSWYDNSFNEDTSVSLVLDGKDKVGGAGGAKSTENSNILKRFSTPVCGVISSPYGYRADPFTGEPDIHSGVDIAAESGTPVKAAFNGTVETAENSGGDYGNYVVINHDGFKTLYAHCEKLYVGAGEQVRAGEDIATVGSTGRSTGPHLHFEIKIGDARIDPTPFINVEN